MSLGSSQTLPRFQTNNSSPKQQWEQITVPAPAKEGSTVMYSHLHELRNLVPATAYEAVVTAKNKYGWSEEPSQPFKLYTLGAREFSTAQLPQGRGEPLAAQYMHMLLLATGGDCSNT